MSQEKWFKPKVHTGWDKDMPEPERRAKMLHAHKGDNLAAGRAMMSLANVTEDGETKVAAKRDALFFYRQHRQETRLNQLPRSRFKRLPR